MFNGVEPLFSYRYDMALLKRSTGHSRVARPPTGEHDQRCHTRRAAWRLPEVSSKL